MFVENRLLSATGFRESTTLDTATHELTRAGLTHDGAVEAIAGLVDARLLTSEERGGIRRIELRVSPDVAALPARNASRKSWLIAGPRRKGKPKRTPKRVLAKPPSAPLPSMKRSKKKPKPAGTPISPPAAPAGSRPRQSSSRWSPSLPACLPPCSGGWPKRLLGGVWRSSGPANRITMSRIG